MAEEGSDGFGGHIRHLARDTVLALVTLHVGSATLNSCIRALNSLSNSSYLEPKVRSPELVFQADAPCADRGWRCCWGQVWMA